MTKNLYVSVQQFAPLPPSTIHHGAGVFDILTEADYPHVKEKLAEYSIDAAGKRTQVFKKPSFTPKERPKKLIGKVKL